ncbi:MAG: FMN-binding protein [Candidatus Ornithomonoglobus sp.]
MTLCLNRITKIMTLLLCMQLTFWTVRVMAETPLLFADKTAISGDTAVTAGEHTITAEAEGDIVCIAVYENSALKALSLGKSLTYSFPSEGAEIRLFCWDSNMRPLCDAVRVTQVKPTLIYNGEAYCTPDEWLDFSEYIVRLTVVTEDGKITEINDIAGYEKSGKPTSSTNASFLKKASSVIKQIIKKQSTAVDAVSGATCSSYAIMDAVDAALKSYPQNPPTAQPVETEKPAIADGIYRGSAQCLTKNINYMIDLDVQIQDGNILSITDRTLRIPMSSTDRDLYDKAFEGISSGKLSADSLGEIDTVSGATVSSAGIISAIENAVTTQAAAKEESGEVYAPEGISLYAQVYPIVTVENGKITNIRIVPGSGTDTEALEVFAEEIKNTQSVRLEYPDDIKDDAFSIANLIDQLLYGKGVLKDE